MGLYGKVSNVIASESAYQIRSLEFMHTRREGLYQSSYQNSNILTFFAFFGGRGGGMFNMVDNREF